MVADLYRLSYTADYGLPDGAPLVKLLDMHTLARLLQFAGLAIPPLVMIAQLNERISAGTMLQFLVLAIGVFLLGYTLQRYSGGTDK